MSTGRNDPCHCGSEKKYKKCCLLKDEEARAAEKAATAVPPSAEDASDPAQSRKVDQLARSGPGNPGVGRLPTRKHVLPRRV